MTARSNLFTIDPDQLIADFVSQDSWPDFVEFWAGDVAETLEDETRTFDLVFASAPYEKLKGVDVVVLDAGIRRLNPGGHLLVDGMQPKPSTNRPPGPRTDRTRARLLSHSGLVGVPIPWSSGLVLCTRRHLA
jgi:predicted O-methyltransferase YrrM